jgi:hypothetical protein
MMPLRVLYHMMKTAGLYLFLLESYSKNSDRHDNKYFAVV